MLEKGLGSVACRGSGSGVALTDTTEDRQPAWLLPALSRRQEAGISARLSEPGTFRDRARGVGVG